MQTRLERQDELVEQILAILRPQLDGRAPLTAGQHRELQAAIASLCCGLQSPRCLIPSSGPSATRCITVADSRRFVSGFDAQRLVLLLLEGLIHGFAIALHRIGQKDFREFGGAGFHNGHLRRHPILQDAPPHFLRVVRYLYAYPAGGIAQPCYFGKVRTDVRHADCTTAQLKFKAEGSEDE